MKKIKTHEAQYDLAIVGGGAAGIFSAIQASVNARSLGIPFLRVIILEGSRRFLTKVKISGGGRCNVTHNEFDINRLVESYPRGSKELRGPFSKFQPKDTIDFFESRDVKLKSEKDGRIFPVTDDSQTIIDCLMSEIEARSIQLKKSFMLKRIEKQNDLFKLTDIKSSVIHARKVIVATGSNVKIWDLLKNLGVNIVSPVPSLFTFTVQSDLIQGLSGISFGDVSLSLKVDGHHDKPSVYSFRGPLLITHWGLSGPAVLKLSAFAARDLFKSNYRAKLICNFLPEFSKEKAFGWIIEEAKKSPRRKVGKFCPFDAFSKRFWLRLVRHINIDPDRNWSELSNKNFRRLAENIVACPFDVVAKGEFKEEFVTAGGVELRDVNFKTMESKDIKGMHFSGEILNIDGVTGGFNFQNAWTTATIAARGVVDCLSTEKSRVDPFL